jgi:hypothetical protein
MAEERDEERADRGARRALPVFNGRSSGFPVWKARVRAWLQAESPPLLYVLDGAGAANLALQDATAQGAAGPASAATASSSGNAPGGAAGAKAAKKREERLELDRLRVYNALISALDDVHVGIIVSEVAEGDAQGAWKILLRKYERNTAASRNQLRRELHTLRLASKESVDEYKARGLHIAARLRATKEVVSDGEVLFCLLEGLPAAYDMVRQALEVQDIVELETACSHLREVEDKIRRRAVGPSASAVSKSAARTSESVQGEGASEVAPAGQLNRMGAEGPGWRPGGGASGSRPRQPCVVCGKQGHGLWECSRRKTSGCFRCGARGHSVRECHCPYEMSETGAYVVEDEDLEDPSEGKTAHRPQTPVPRAGSSTRDW